MLDNTYLETHPTSVLFHGPNAQEDALYAAQEYGRILGVFGEDKGLRVKDARELVALLLSPPICDRMGSVVARISQSTPEAADALLKQIEEPRAEALPFLWALDLGDVIPTIRSRCLCIWSPGVSDISLLDQEASYIELLAKASQGSSVAIRELLQGAKGLDMQRELLDHILMSLYSQKDANHFGDMWVRLRECLGYESRIALASAVVGGAE